MSSKSEKSKISSKKLNGRIFLFSDRNSKDKVAEIKQTINELDPEFEQYIAEIKLDGKPHIKQIMTKESSVKEEVPQIFFNSKYYGGIKLLLDEKVNQKEKLLERIKTILNEETGYIYQVYKRQTELFLILPPELYFPLPPVIKTYTCIVQLQNLTDFYAAFRLKTTAPKRYIVKPKDGIVAPHQSERIEIILNRDTSSVPMDDKFRVESVKISNISQLQDPNSTSEAFKLYEKNTIKQKIVCNFGVSPENIKTTEISEGQCLIELMESKDGEYNFMSFSSQDPEDKGQSPRLESKPSFKEVTTSPLKSDPSFKIIDQGTLIQNIEKKKENEKKDLGESFIEKVQLVLSQEELNEFKILFENLKEKSHDVLESITYKFKNFFEKVSNKDELFNGLKEFLPEEFHVKFEKIINEKVEEIKEQAKVEEVKEEIKVETEVKENVEVKEEVKPVEKIEVKEEVKPVQVKPVIEVPKEPVKEIKIEPQIEQVDSPIIEKKIDNKTPTIEVTKEEEIKEEKKEKKIEIKIPAKEVIKEEPKIEVKETNIEVKDLKYEIELKKEIQKKNQEIESLKTQISKLLVDIHQHKDPQNVEEQEEKYSIYVLMFVALLFYWAGKWL